MVYRVPVEPYRNEILIKNSRFITYLEPVSSVDAVKSRLDDLRVRYPDCSHVCYAYIADSPDSTLMGLSDDGEPSGTAGKPMLNILKHANVGHTLVAIVRYFGGTKLGTGGLQRAYSSCTQTALLKAQWQAFRATCDLVIEAQYEDETMIRHKLEKYEATLIEVNYQMVLNMRIRAYETSAQSLINALVDATAGRAHLIRKSS